MPADRDRRRRKQQLASRRSGGPDVRATIFPDPPPVPTVGEPDTDLLAILGPGQLKRIVRTLDALYLDLGEEYA